MADIDAPRTFPNDPNPPPKGAPATAAPAAAAPESGTGGAVGTPVSTPPAAQSRPAKASFRVSSDEGGQQSVYMMDDKLETTRLGTVNIADADELLTAIGTFNPVTKAWNVPEDAARQLLSGDMPFPEYLPAKYRANKALIANGVIWTEWLGGKISLEEAQGRGDLELIKQQIKEAPLFVYQGSVTKTAAKMWDDVKAAGPLGVARRVAGETAGQAAFITDAPMAAAFAASVGASLIATRGASAAVVLPALAVAIERGALATVFKRAYEIEGGNAAGEMINKGFEEETVKRLAPLVGVVNGFLETLGFRMLPAPIKRVLARKVLGSGPVKKVLANAYVSYAKELGVEVTTEIAQESMNIYTESLAAEADNRPDLASTKEEILSQLGEVALKTLAGTGGLKTPGLVLEAATQRADAKATKELDALIEERKQEKAADEKAKSVAANVERVKKSIAEPPLPAGEAKGIESLTATATIEEPGAPDTVSEVPSGSPVKRIFIAWGKDGKKKGALSVGKKSTDEPALLEIFVDPEFRRKGVATGLYDAAEAAGIDVGSALGFFGTTEAGGRFIAARVGIKSEESKDDKKEEKAEAKEAEAVPEEVKPPPGTATKLDEIAQKADKKELTPEEAAEQLDDALGVSLAKELGLVESRPPTLEEQTREVEAAGRVEVLQAERDALATRTDDLIAKRQKAALAGRGTKVVDAQIKDLLDTEQRLKEEQTFFESRPTAVVADKAAKLAIRPATLENIVAFGFKEGAKEGKQEVRTLIKGRAQQIKKISEELGLTNADMKVLMQSKNLSTLGDVAFRNWLFGKPGAPGFVGRARAHVNRKTAKERVRATIKEREIKGERNLRAVNKLPATNKMTTAQLNSYVDLLSQFDVGSSFMTPKRVKSLEGTALAGALTYQQVLAKAAKDLQVTVPELLLSQGSQFDFLRGDTGLSEAQPIYAFAVYQVQTEQAIAEATFQEFERANLRLGSAALVSRSNILRRLVPSMPEVMAALEATPGPALEAAEAVLTPAEQTYVDFMRDFFQTARDYLRQTGELESTRFEDTFAPHTRRPVIKIVAGIRSFKGAAEAVGEFFSNVFAFQKELGAPESGGPALGLKKFFSHTLFRSGKLTPDDNVIRITNSYAKQFFKKQALDRSVPVVDTTVLALEAVSKDQTEEGKDAWKRMGKFLKTYLNNKKGNNNVLDVVAPRGGVVDVLIRGVSGMVSLAYIAGNAALQVAAPVGETIAAKTLLGKTGMALAEWRRTRHRAQAKKILDKYEHFTGKGFLAPIFEAGKNIDERGMSAVYAMLQWARTRTLGTVLLASMTEAEFQAGEISPRRLAEIKVRAGRWIDVPGMKSVVGSTSIGAAATKFRGWALPVLRSTTQNIQSLIDSIGVKTPGSKPLTTDQAWELYNIAETTLVVSMVFLATVDADEDDNTFLGQLKRKVLREMFTLTQVFDPKFLFSAGPVVGYLAQMAENIAMLLTLEEFKSGEREGELKGLSGLYRQLPFSAAVRNFTKESKK